MKKGFGSGFFAGLLCTVLAAGLGVTALAAGRSITVEDGVHITVNGALFTPKDTAGKELSSFTHNDTAYVPAAALCEALGLTANYDAASRTLILTVPAAPAASAPASSFSGSYITTGQAKEIALNHAGVRAADASFIKTELEWEDGRAEYEVEFYAKSTEYDYEIDALTGAILSFDHDVENFQIPGNQAPSSGYITTDRAKEVALRHAPDGSTIKKCKLEYDDGRAVYELELYSGRTEYECEIDALSGDVISWEIDD